MLKFQNYNRNRICTEFLTCPVWFVRFIKDPPLAPGVWLLKVRDDSITTVGVRIKMRVSVYLCKVREEIFFLEVSQLL